MRIIQKTLKLGPKEYYETHLSIINPIFEDHLTKKEVEVLAAFMSLDKNLIDDDMFNTIARKRVKKKLGGMSSGSLGNHLKSMINKGFLTRNEITDKIFIRDFLLPEDNFQGYQFKIEKNEGE